MCCFARAVQSVTDTNIFARLSGTGSQYLAYQMQYDSIEPNAMILPLPVSLPADEQSVRFIDLSDYENFFQDLSQGFPYIPRRQIGCSILPLTDSAAGKIEVHEVGHFIASFVPSISDFSRIDDQFVIPEKTWQKIPNYSDFGFALFQLKELSGKPHPMAFEFKTRLQDIFFPTVHIHDGEVHRLEEFDHTLYLQHAGFDSIVGSYAGPAKQDSNSGLVRSKDLAQNYCQIQKTKGIVASDLLLHRTTLQGQLENRDMVYAAAGSPIVPHFNLRKWLPYWPWALPALAIAWLINRRNRLRSEASQNSSLEN